MAKTLRGALADPESLLLDCRVAPEILARLKALTHPPLYFDERTGAQRPTLGCRLPPFPGWTPTLGDREGILGAQYLIVAVDLKKRQLHFAEMIRSLVKRARTHCPTCKQEIPIMRRIRERVSYIGAVPLDVDVQPLIGKPLNAARREIFASVAHAAARAT